MKKISLFILFASVCAIYSCKKNKTTTEPEASTPVSTPTYASLADFYSKNGVPLQTFTINAGSGGSFVSAQNTTINIPANTFTPSSANITIEFKDIYTKSDMLLSNVASNLMTGAPLKSAGEFFIKALTNNVPVDISGVGGIDVLQPFKQAKDTAMKAFAAGADSLKNLSWYQTTDYSLLQNASNYIFSFYKFNIPLGNGTWCNSDNSGYFANYPQTQLTIHPNQTGYSTDVYLVFKNVNSMVHVYKSGGSNNFNYNYAPVGLECTVVALGLKDGKLYSSFKFVKISANQNLNFDLTETTLENFKTSLKALD